MCFVSYSQHFFVSMQQNVPNKSEGGTEARRSLGRSDQTIYQKTQKVGCV